MPLSARTIASLVILAPALALSAQQSAAPSAAPRIPTIQKNVRVVLFDMVVTDRHNHPFRKLRPEDVTVYDNGVPQHLLSFRLIVRPNVPPPPSLEATTPAARAAAAALPPPPALRAPNFVAFVFDQMGPADARESRRGALDFINRDMNAGDYAAVYAIGLRDVVLAPFTTDRATVREAVLLATGAQQSRFANMIPQNSMDSSVQGSSGPGGISPLGIPDNSTGSGTPNAGGLVAQAETELSGNMQAEHDVIQNTAAAHASLDGLLDVVHGLENFPGRKAVLYFTPLMPVDTSTDNLIASLIHQADGDRISFFTIDPSGLGETGENTQATQRLFQAAAVSASQRANGQVTDAQAHEMDAIDNVFDSGPARMRQLAEETGGEYIRDRNNLAPALAKVASVISEHYELSWTPSSGFDGQYHTITVQLDRPNLVVHARGGYDAVTGYAASASGLADQQPLYALLDRDLEQHPKPAPVRISQSALIFPLAAGHPEAELMASVHLDQLMIRPATPAEIQARPALQGRDVLRFDVLQVVRDSAGNIIRAFRKAVSMSVPSDRLARVRGGHFNFDHDVLLTPGKYRVETAVYQDESQLGGVATSLLDFPPQRSGGRIRLSPVVLVESADSLAAPPPDPGPLDFQGYQLRPNLARTVEVGRNPRSVLAFYFIASVPADAGQAYVILRVRQGGRLVAAPTAPLPPPNAAGEIRYLANLPAAAFKPGEYQIAFRVQAGALAAEQQTSFTVEK